MITLQRISAIVFRHLMTMYRVSWLVEITYWTLLDTVIFGSLGKATTMLAPTGSDVAIVQALITNTILWYIVLRCAITIGFCLLNELFDANLIVLFATPLRKLEWIIGCIITGSITALINVSIGWLLAWYFFGCNIFAFGLPAFAALCALLISGWILGLLIMCVVLFVGKKGTSWAFIIVWSLVPFSCVYYPLDVLPRVLQVLASGIPMAHVFVGMRELIMHGTNPWVHIGISFVLDIIYLVLAIILFVLMFKRSKKSGLARLELEW